MTKFWNDIGKITSISKKLNNRALVAKININRKRASERSLEMDRLNSQHVIYVIWLKLEYRRIVFSDFVVFASLVSPFSDNNIVFFDSEIQKWFLRFFPGTCQHLRKFAAIRENHSNDANIITISNLSTEIIATSASCKPYIRIT